MSSIFKCDHCGHQGVRAGNGFSSWCAKCGMNNRLVKVAKKSDIGDTVNGQLHLANMEVHEYDGLKFVTESPQPGAVRLTIYRGEEPIPMSTEVYGNENS